ncbi:amylo-alpha-1,6-glucosidase [Paludisphaera mucosa]|uniref:Amylo-alpha-1,6-glucosidase n=1 Tax=Paludisphaera mucosa TaxID=3030827 RepID=A0ABT6FJH7_9BACT|nr:amylo-alpha-1,6-glucosidase [Paludisphaera mucosa]MDG3007740.1 amylo-alpha-1,6-glucosidase [Paludisphaera mucosa]
MSDPEARRSPGAAPEGDPHHVLAAASLADDRTRVLKHGDTFAVFDHLGRMLPGGLGEQGVYHDGTRHLSHLSLELDDRPPFFLGSTVRDENDQLSVALTNPDRIRDGRIDLPLGTLHLAVQALLWRGVLHWRLRATNHGMRPVEASIRLRLRADFADIYEVRGMTRSARGRDSAPEASPGRLELGYLGLDGVRRRTVIRFSPAPAEADVDGGRFRLALGPREGASIDVAVACRRGDDAPEPQAFDEAEAEVVGSIRRYGSASCRIASPDGRVDAWFRRSEADLHMLTTDLPTGSYPYAGVPWFNAPFGRDGLVTALECLWLRPELARGVLRHLAATQATESIPSQDAEPGKILHEARDGEMAALGEMPFGRYYGSVDATPLFVVLAGSYCERTADRAFVGSIWPNVEAALAWIDAFGDRDGDGFVEYERRAADGLIHQGWKDSDDAVFHADGSPARGPIAVCEVQAYVYAALRAGAVLARALGREGRAAAFEGRADRLRERFEAAFWCEEMGTYALALDGDKRPCRVRSSNAGQCLFGGIASPERAARVERGLASADFFSGWGVRTLATSESRYNPMSYHNGAVWPHDNALIAFGAARYGRKDLASAILSGLFAAGTYLDLSRMPELFCGFGRVPGEGPVPYPVACAPQAWAAGSVYLLLQACLGLTVDAAERKIRFQRPRLPSVLPELRITNLHVAGGAADLRIARRGDAVSVDVLRRDGDFAVEILD